VTGAIRRQPEISFQTATEAGLEGLKDIVIEELILIGAVTTAEEWINRIAKLPL